MRLIETTVAINDNRKRAMGRKVIAACDGTVRGKKIAVLGLTFKPNTDDMRDAPSITIIQALLDGGAEVHAYDPEGMDDAKELLGAVTYGKDPYEIAQDADAIVIVTEWDEFRALDFKRLKTTVKTPTIVDLRNIYPAAEVSRHGFSYFAVGKKSEKQ
jgi:UDPglucose 6-dehydrogenase